MSATSDAVGPLCYCNRDSIPHWHDFGNVLLKTHPLYSRTLCAVCKQAEPHRGPEGCDRVLPAPARCICTPLKCFMECPACGGPARHTSCKAEPSCEACGDTGRVPVWRMGFYGYEEDTERCKHCGEEK